MKTIDLSRFTSRDILTDGNKYTFPQRNGFLTTECGKGEICGYKAVNGEYLVVDLTNHSDYSSGIIISFSTDPNEYYGGIWFKYGVLPQLRTRFVLPLSALDGGILFLERTPGRLKCVTCGRPIKLEDICKVTISAAPACDNTVIEIHDMFITDSEPDYPVEKKAMIDTLGQKKNTTWKGKTENESELIEFLQSEASKKLEEKSLFDDRSQYGGWIKKRFDPTGYFALEHDGRRWWLKDPDGYAFFSVGIDCVGIDGVCNVNGILQLCEEIPEYNNPGWTQYRNRQNQSDRPQRRRFTWHASNLYKAFGDKWFDKWCDITDRRMNEWGFNTIACWSDKNYITRAKVPYVYLLGRYPHTEKMIFRDFPDVFSDEYKRNSELWAEPLKDVAGDKRVIGYFMSNEPMWAFVNNVNPAAMLLESDQDFVSKRYLINFIKEKYQEIEKLNEAWGKSFASFNDLYQAEDTSKFNEIAIADLYEFSAKMIHEYIKVPALAAKANDPNHLNLGIRYAWLSSKMLASGSEYIDVYSFNCYSMDPTDTIERTIALVDKPVMIGEFHFGALDRGMDSTGLRGVASQEERGKAYRYYMEKAALHPYCLGAHYFTLNDQAYLGRDDGENYQIGIVDVCNKPYYEFLDGIIAANKVIYDIADGNIEPRSEKSIEAPTVAF